MSQILPPMPELVGEVIRLREWIKGLPVPMPEPIRVALARRRARRMIAEAYTRMRQVKAQEARAARMPAEPEPQPEPPPRLQVVRLDEPMPQGAHPIESLEENQYGLLFLPEREVRGFFRWEKSKSKRSKGERNVRAFYELVAGGKAVRIPHADRPKFFKPVRPLNAEPNEIIRPPAIDARPPKREMPDELVEATSGTLSESEVRNRVYWAVRTLQALPRDLHDKFLNMGSRVSWPALKAEYSDIEARRENQDNADSALRNRRWRPSAAHLADMDEPLEWFTALNDLTVKQRQAHVRAGELALSESQWLIWWRGRDKSYSKVAKEIGGSDETARRRTGEVFERLTRIANEPGRIAARRARAAAIDLQSEAERPSGRDQGRPQVAREKQSDDDRRRRDLAERSLEVGTIGA